MLNYIGTLASINYIDKKNKRSNSGFHLEEKIFRHDMIDQLEFCSNLFDRITASDPVLNTIRDKLSLTF